MPSPVDPGHTAFMLVATGLVMLMTPGLAFFYGGLVSGRNVLSTIMHCFIALGIVTLQWILIGYTLVFGPSIGGWIGGASHAFLNGVGAAPASPDHSFPHLAFMAYQMMFAIITPALIAGAFAERMKFSAYCLFIALWTTLVYDPLAHWVWNPGGWLAKLGAIDFAGGIVVHVSAGFSALVAAVVIGRRLGFISSVFPPHDLTLTAIGGGLLLFGWYGFNAGSALKADGLAALALVNTHIAAGLGALAWAACDALRQKHVPMVGILSGLVAGLVAVTPAAGFVSPLSAALIGVIAALACRWVIDILKHSLSVDDSLDAFGLHGVGGVVGSILTGVFATTALNPAGKDGLILGTGTLLLRQVAATAIAAMLSCLGTWAILKCIDRIVGLRVSEDVERTGLDQPMHGQRAYTATDH